VIFQHRFHATVVDPREMTVNVYPIQLPDCSDVFQSATGRRRDGFMALKPCFQRSLGIQQRFYPVMRQILGSVAIEGVDYGLGVIKQLPSGRFARRLGLVHFGEDPEWQIEISPRVRDAVMEWYRSARPIPELLQARRPLSIQAVFGGDLEAARRLRHWLDGLFPDSTFPFVEVGLPHTRMAEIARRLERVNSTPQLRRVSPEDLIRRPSGSDAIDRTKPVISVAPDESFGLAGYAVGTSPGDRTAAVLFTQENAAFTNFGCPEITKKIGKVVPLSALLQLPDLSPATDPTSAGK
jgi:hypothetical protein